MALAYIYIHQAAQQPVDMWAFLQPLKPTEQTHVRLYNYYFKTL